MVFPAELKASTQPTAPPIASTYTIADEDGDTDTATVTVTIELIL